MEEVLACTSTEVESEEISEYEPEPIEKISKPINMAPGAVKLRTWLNKTFRVEMTDGRVLIGVFLCTDRDANVILGSCSEYLPSDGEIKALNEEPRMLGLVMIPGKHIVSVHIDMNECDTGVFHSLNKNISSDNVM